MVINLSGDGMVIVFRWNGILFGMNMSFPHKKRAKS